MERRQIVALGRKGAATALVTLVRTEGSSYRRRGARILIGSSGGFAGTVSGGCLEAEVVRKAAWLVRSGAVVERYSTLFDDIAEIPFGLGCGGVVDLLIEPAGTSEFAAVMEALERSLRGEESTVVTFLPDAGSGKSLHRLVLAVDGTVLFASDALEPKKIACACKLIPGEEYEGRFVEELRRPHRLVVLGAGEDARPLVSMAALLGWSVVVADGRTQFARADRFPEAERVDSLNGSASVVSQLSIQAQDAVVLMTHSYEQDRDLLAAVLPVAPRYLGVLGARHRTSLLVSEAAAITSLTVAECCARLYAPVGLDLGGDGPEAIALAVLAEAHACVHGKLGTSRRLSAEDVARQIAEGGASRYLQVQCALDAAS